mmetsp:Transcript_3069/g.4136  ORF Transcript_3069/g.4136 Transcript_3069/m.4136 type:complete len:185 (+) Transcript_3069:172-726(+)|eukprot:CAMPEP_0198151088 /NCGR_PEP_ID=MMETSP1443-20131203/54168_1 /TAXON_ID=186043 /ORGANISM="Entomoneis sp., Strain CCMP2396" /LENGTH=184 /DNA_ID=CAMNT_0043816643 /DNA_START=81 /DNA_END=635 /DNA_ORIENTATION=+
MKYIFAFAALLSSAMAFAPLRPVLKRQQGVMEFNSPLRMVQDSSRSTGLLEKSNGGQETVNGSTEISGTEIQEEEKSETKKLLEKIKASGKAGVISYALWELVFWFVSIPIAVLGYLNVAGHWPDFSNSDDVAGVGAEAFAFVNFARFAVPLRIGLALSSVGFVQENVVDRFFPEEEKKEETSD